MSSSSSSESDDEMRSKILASCVTAQMVKATAKKVDLVKQQMIKVGPYNDIELSKLQLAKLILILDHYTEETFHFREPKKRTNQRLADQERIFEECANHKMIANGALIDMDPPPPPVRKRKRVKETKEEKLEKRRQIASMAVTFDQIKTMV